jgi:hypothetical protein
MKLPGQNDASLSSFAEFWCVADSEGAPEPPGKTHPPQTARGHPRSGRSAARNPTTDYYFSQLLHSKY